MTFRLSNDEYRADESDGAANVRIIRDMISTMTLANPVMFRVSSLTVDDALDMGIISSFLPEDGLTSNEIQLSPLRASIVIPKTPAHNGLVLCIMYVDEDDFSATSINTIFAADENNNSPISAIDVPVSIADDDIDESCEQYFIVMVEIIDAVNVASLNLGLSVATVIIGDNDGNYCKEIEVM